jgi:hypothetical protein
MQFFDSTLFSGSLGTKYKAPTKGPKCPQPKTINCDCKWNAKYKNKQVIKIIIEKINQLA